MSDSRRARSFGQRPAEYHEHRPTYPAEAVRWALAGASRQVTTVLDLAAGTGKITEALLPLGRRVTAVEPDDGMRGVLAERFPGVTALAGTAEEIPLPAGSVDAVLVGQAFHWFDPLPALDEIARVLRPGGVLGVLWNGEAPDVAWVTGLMEVSRTSATGGFQGEVELPEHASFGPVERTVLRHALPRTAESMIDYLGTHSRILVVDLAERAEVLGRVRAYLRVRPETASGEFDLPLVVEAIRSRRLD